MLCFYINEKGVLNMDISKYAEYVVKEKELPMSAKMEDIPKIVKSLTLMLVDKDVNNKKYKDTGI